MLKCIAIDDEPLALQLLADNISKVPYLDPVAFCNDAFEAMKAMQQEKIDLIFIDIQMPGLTGLQFIESLVDKPMVILITAYRQYALESYSLDVIDYLVKPVPLDRFIKACNKAQELYGLKNAVQNQSARPEYVFVNVGYSLEKILFNDILYIEGLREYLQIHLINVPRPLIVRMALKTMEEQLPATLFVRIHKSYIAAIPAITAIRKNSIFIGKMELPVGESYKNAVEKIVRSAS